MTENEARGLVERIRNLCRQQERDCDDTVMFDVHEQGKSATKLKFLKFEGSIKIDK